MCTTKKNPTNKNNYIDLDSFCDVSVYGFCLCPCTISDKDTRSHNPPKRLRQLGDLSDARRSVHSILSDYLCVGEFCSEFRNTCFHTNILCCLMLSEIRVSETRRMCLYIYIYVSIYMYPVASLLFRNILANARIASSTETVMIGQSGHACLTSHCHVSRCDGASFSH